MSSCGRADFRVFCGNGQAVKRSGAERESRRTAEESGMWRAYLRRERVTLERDMVREAVECAALLPAK